MTHHKRWLVLVTGLQGTGKSTVAEIAADLLGAPVLAHDWAMSGLRPYPPVQHALDTMDPPGHRVVGWSILAALARSQLRRDSSVVLDGMARPPEVEFCRQVARDEGSGFALVVTERDDLEVHRSRIEGRQRNIPNWYELDWDHVQHARSHWEKLRQADLHLQCTDPPSEHAALLQRFFHNVGALPNRTAVEG